MTDALTIALDELAQVLVREGEHSERELAATMGRNTAFTWPEDAPALHESLRTWFRWRAIEEAPRPPLLWLEFPPPEQRRIWTQLLSPDTALAGWQARAAQQPDPFLEVLRGVYVHLTDGSVWVHGGAENVSIPEALVRVADSLLQLVQQTTGYYAARASSPWRALRLDSTTEPMGVVPAPDDSRLMALPTGTALLLRWSRLYSSGRHSDRALLGVRVDGDRWLVRTDSTASDSVNDIIESQLEQFRYACYRTEPTCMSTAEFSRELREASETTKSRKLLDLHQGRVRVWKQGELGSVLERLRDVLAARSPDVAASLRGAASPQTIQELETSMGQPLPADLSGLLSWADGQAPGAMPFRLNMRLLSAAEMSAEAHSMRKLQREGVLQPFWWNDGFLPFCSNGSGDSFCLDLRGIYGPKGSVLEFDHKNSQRRIEAASLGQWLEAYVDGLEAGHWDVEDGQLTPRDWEGVKAFERVRTPGYPRELPCDAPALWLPADTHPSS